MSLKDEAHELLLYQFKDAPKIKGLLAGLIAPLDELLEQCEKLHHGRYIEKAGNRTLDILGEIVDFKRGHRSDDEYKAWLQVAVLLNNAKGTASSVLAIVGVLFENQEDAIEISEHGSHVVMFTFFKKSHIPQDILFSIFRCALPLCARAEFVDASMMLSKDGAPKVFQFDVSEFDHSFFADFFKETA